VKEREKIIFKKKRKEKNKHCDEAQERKKKSYLI
jgi:hypothetical protein